MAERWTERTTQLVDRYAREVYRVAVASGADRARRVRYPARLVVRLESERYADWRRWARERGVGVSAMVRVIVDEYMRADAAKREKP